MLIIVVDYGVGNLRSISKSLEKTSSDSNLNCSIKVSSTITDIKKADKLVLPGQGSFKTCKKGIENIKGLEAGVQRMREGTYAQLWIPSKLAYGIRGAPPLIPANADITFDRISAIESIFRTI